MQRTRRYLWEFFHVHYISTLVAACDKVVRGKVALGIARDTRKVLAFRQAGKQAGRYR
jgi:hypothetical protein